MKTLTNKIDEIVEDINMGDDEWVKKYGDIALQAIIIRAVKERDEYVIGKDDSAPYSLDGDEFEVENAINVEKRKQRERAEESL